MFKWFSLATSIVQLTVLFVTYLKEKQLISQAEHALLAKQLAEQDKIIEEAERIRNTPIPDGVPDEFDRSQSKP